MADASRAACAHAHVRPQPCLPYKQMKKVLKKTDELHFFTVLKHSLCELETSFDVALADVIDAVDSVLLREACKLASWVELNATAARKIVKKHDKQHGGTHGAAWFAEEYGRSGLFGDSSALLHDLLLSLSLDEFAPSAPSATTSDVLGGGGGSGGVGGGSGGAEGSLDGAHAHAHAARAPDGGALVAGGDSNGVDRFVDRFANADEASLANARALDRAVRAGLRVAMLRQSSGTHGSHALAGQPLEGAGGGAGAGSGSAAGAQSRRYSRADSISSTGFDEIESALSLIHI